MSTLALPLPFGVTACDPSGVYLFPTGGVPPYTINILSASGAQLEQVPETATGSSENYYIWLPVDLPAGTIIKFEAIDSVGSFVTTSEVTIAAGSNTGCSKGSISLSDQVSSATSDPFSVGRTTASSLGAAPNTTGTATGSPLSATARYIVIGTVVGLFLLILAIGVWLWKRWKNVMRRRKLKDDQSQLSPKYYPTPSANPTSEFVLPLHPPNQSKPTASSSHWNDRFVHPAPPLPARPVPTPTARVTPPHSARERPPSVWEPYDEGLYNTPVEPVRGAQRAASNHTAEPRVFATPLNQRRHSTRAGLQPPNQVRQAAGQSQDPLIRSDNPDEDPTDQVFSMAASGGTR